MIKTIFKYILGGRPMKYQGTAFCDVVSGRWVRYYKDQFNRYWLAEHKWSWFRVSLDRND